jgi:RimJ/RimL family protein N-acetyltransferase
VPEPSILPVPLRFGAYTLDAARPDDVDAVVAAVADPDIAQWNNPARRGDATVRERAERWVAGRTAWTRDHCSWVVRDADGRLLGQVSIHSIDTVPGSGEMGYWLTPDARGRGIGAAAVDTASRFAFDLLGLSRLELFHAVVNEASCRLALRCGYLLEGTARESFVYGDGRRYDEHLHGRLARDAVEPVPLPR